MSIKEVQFGDWEKIDLRVAEIKQVEDIEGADKLYKIILDVGEIGERTVCAGIKKYYSKEELAGKKVVLFSNLVPRKLRGIESQGMILAAGGINSDTCVLLSPEKDVEPGTQIS
jgi:methionine--tRNA ligase beta chain